MQSFYCQMVFGSDHTESEKWAFTDELLEVLEKAGFIAGGVQNAGTLDLAVDSHCDNDMSPTIETHIQSLCGQHPCVVRWQRRNEAEIV